jgi:hypothetical protein
LALPVGTSIPMGKDGFPIDGKRKGMWPREQTDLTSLKFG